ncbi:MAG: RluA family pseudouridine synthase [Candidatus Eremiobacteraeota bacterium]|nr:RluA family pseudouridine synthase [Candidatus Eremiobacteraeota bacterium]
MPEFRVAPEDGGRRIDLLVAHHSGSSRSLVAQAIRNGSVRLNGEPIEKGSVAVAEGDTIAFEVPERVALAALAEELPLDVVYEDDDLLVVNKAAGMVTHPAHGAPDGTLVNALLAHVGTLPGDPLRPGLVHRLDRDTSGLLVVAKTADVLSALGKAMMRRFIQREYLGLVAGVPQHAEGTIEGAIGRDERNRLKYAIRGDGKPAVTHYALRERLGDTSELVFRLETGRTHQIRVHLTAFGLPIVNDLLYGKRDPRVNLPGQALHAWRLRFRHPASREELSFEVSPPPAYAAAKAALRA